MVINDEVHIGFCTVNRIMTQEHKNLIKRVKQYQQVLENTIMYRSLWHNEVREKIFQTLSELVEETGLDAEIYVEDDIENLESVVLDLGRVSSGISETLGKKDFKRTMVKYNGALIYQQLFNGKIMVMFNSPYIEGYGEPKQPKMIEILRPDELTPPFFIRHMETFIRDITEWEDYDDDKTTTSSHAAFQPIGFFRETES